VTAITCRLERPENPKLHYYSPSVPHSQRYPALTAI
jgi:hypothetical protein